MFNLESHELKTILSTTLIGVVIGTIYTQIAYISRPDADAELWLGMGIGATIGMLITCFEVVFVGRPNSRIRQLPFLLSLVVRAIVHFLTIFFSIYLWQNIFGIVTGREIVILSLNSSETTQDFIVSMIIVAIIIFYMQMQLFIGSRPLRNLIVGRYNTPREEQRIFMIIDMVGSTEFAQNTGDVVFHQYLNRLFILMDGPIHRYGGEVHAYVGDAVFAVWPVTNDPEKDARPLKALADIKALLEKRSDQIENEFGQRPEIRVAVHKGPVAVGETGHRKRQITYLGNTVNLASRIEALTRTVSGNTLASSEYLGSVQLPDDLLVTELGTFEVKGSSRPLQLSKLERRKSC